MKENKYDNASFFEKYKQMERSQKGLEGAGEWETLKNMLPDFNGKRVLDLGCGFGWHCQYAVQNGATSIIGVDISEKMLAFARESNYFEQITYIQMPTEDIDFSPNSFDIVISSLSLHYLKSFEDIAQKTQKILSPDGQFIFSAEHPVFTAYGSQDWIYSENGQILYFPVDNYFCEGERNTRFLHEQVIKYHRTMTTYLQTLLANGFAIKDFAEPKPTEKMLQEIPDMKDELRRPMMFIVSAQKM